VVKLQVQIFRLEIVSCQNICNPKIWKSENPKIYYPPFFYSSSQKVPVLRTKPKPYPNHSGRRGCEVSGLTGQNPSGIVKGSQ